MHTHSPKKPKKFKQTLPESWWQLFPGTGKEHWQWNSFSEGPQCQMCIAKHWKNCVGPFRTKAVECWDPV
jgi:hypothetical protein